VARVSGDGTLK